VGAPLLAAFARSGILGTRTVPRALPPKPLHRTSTFRIGARIYACRKIRCSSFRLQALLIDLRPSPPSRVPIPPKPLLAPVRFVSGHAFMRAAKSAAHHSAFRRCSLIFGLPPVTRTHSSETTPPLCAAHLPPERSSIPTRVPLYTSWQTFSSFPASLYPRSRAAHHAACVP
jgi:hypothetical protein